MIRNVWWEPGPKHFLVRGKPVKKLVGRTSFDWASIVSYHYAGRGNDIPGGALNVAKQWVEHNQKIFDREDVVLVVFNEEGGWDTCPGDPPGCMFGQEPRDQGMWNMTQLQRLAANGDRVKREHFSAMNLKTIEFAFQVSHETGCIFDWCADATLKHHTGINVGTIDHIIRQTGRWMRELQVKYPKAAFIVRPRNEWRAHQGHPVTLGNVNAWAQRWYRWKHPDGQTRLSFESPGPAWMAEQWPEAMFITDIGGGNKVHEEIGPEPGKYKIANIHIERKGAAWDWRAPVPQMDQLRTDARGQAVGSNENMYAVTKPGTLQWYRNANGYNVVFENKGLADQMLFYENNVPIFDYFCVHDDIGKKANASWNKDSKFEAALAEFFGGNVVQPPPVERFRYADQIQHDWNLILGHSLGNEDVMRARNEMYRLYYEEGGERGLSKAMHQDVLLRSEEFKSRN